MASPRAGLSRWAPPDGRGLPGGLEQILEPFLAARHPFSPPPARSGQGHDLARAARGQGAILLQRDAVADETHRAVGHGELNPAGMKTTEGVGVLPLRTGVG